LVAKSALTLAHSSSRWNALFASDPRSDTHQWLVTPLGGFCAMAHARTVAQSARSTLSRILPNSARARANVCGKPDASESIA